MRMKVLIDVPQDSLFLVLMKDDGGDVSGWPRSDGAPTDEVPGIGPGSEDCDARH